MDDRLTLVDLYTNHLKSGDADNFEQFTSQYKAPDNLDEFSFDRTFFVIEDGLLVMRLENDNDNSIIKYLYVVNDHNGYYAHAFDFLAGYIKSEGKI